MRPAGHWHKLRAASAAWASCTGMPGCTPAACALPMAPACSCRRWSISSGWQRMCRRRSASTPRASTSAAPSCMASGAGRITRCAPCCGPATHPASTNTSPALPTPPGRSGRRPAAGSPGHPGQPPAAPPAGTGPPRGLKGWRNGPAAQPLPPGPQHACRARQVAFATRQGQAQPACRYARQRRCPQALGDELVGGRGLGGVTQPCWPPRGGTKAWRHALNHGCARQAGALLPLRFSQPMRRTCSTCQR